MRSRVLGVNEFADEVGLVSSFSSSSAVVRSCSIVHRRKDF